MTDTKDNPEDWVCAFCGYKRNRAWHLVHGNGMYICDRCTDLTIQIFEDNDERCPPPAEKPLPEPDSVFKRHNRCAFCNELRHSSDKVVGMKYHVEGEPVICRSCVELARQVFVEDHGWDVGVKGSWYRALRHTMMEWIWAPRAKSRYSPDEIEELGAELAREAPARMASFKETDESEASRTTRLKKLFAKVLLELVERPIVYDSAVRLGEEWLQHESVRRTEPKCGFCGRSRSRVRKLVEGLALHICGDCACSLIESRQAKDSSASGRCSYCGRRKRPVYAKSGPFEGLVSGPAVCRACLEIIHQILVDEAPARLAAPAGQAGLPVPPEETADTGGDGSWESALRPLSEWICSPGSRNACSPEEIEELSAELAHEGPARFKAFFDSQYDNPDARERFQMTKLKDLFAGVLKERLFARKRAIAFDDAVQLGEVWVPLGARLFLEYQPEERSFAGAFGTNIRRGDPDGICLFCGGPERQRPAMISVGTGTACGKCIDVCNEQFLVVLEREKAGTAPPADPDAAATRCSFCGEKPRERCFSTRSILKSGPTPAICEGCLDRFNELALADLEDLEEPE